MPKEEWGVKRVCPDTSCATRFYDLKNDPMTCPACGNEFTLESLTGNKSRTMTADKPDAQNKDNKTEVEGEEDVVLEDDEDDVDADVDLGDDVLEDDDDDTVSLDELADVPADDNDD